MLTEVVLRKMRGTNRVKRSATYTCWYTHLWNRIVAHSTGSRESKIYVNSGWTPFWKCVVAHKTSRAAVRAGHVFTKRRTTYSLVNHVYTLSTTSKPYLILMEYPKTSVDFMKMFVEQCHIDVQYPLLSVLSQHVLREGIVRVIPVKPSYAYIRIERHLPVDIKGAFVHLRNAE